MLSICPNNTQFHHHHLSNNRTEDSLHNGKRPCLHLHFTLNNSIPSRLRIHNNKYQYSSINSLTLKDPMNIIIIINNSNNNNNKHICNPAQQYHLL